MCKSGSFGFCFRDVGSGGRIGIAGIRGVLRGSFTFPVFFVADNISGCCIYIVTVFIRIHPEFNLVYHNAVLKVEFCFHPTYIGFGKTGMCKGCCLGFIFTNIGFIAGIPNGFNQIGSGCFCGNTSAMQKIQIIDR